MIEDFEQFLKIMKELEPYLVEFEQNGTMKAKNYLSDCKIEGEKCRPIIVIKHDDICKI